MGFWLTRILFSKRDFAHDLAGTEVLTLPKVGILSDLCIQWTPIAGSQNCDVYAPDTLTKVEVIGNGSTVIQSLDGRQIQASHAFDDLVMPPDKEYAPGGGAYSFMDVRFGRYPGDEKYALDCTKWDSLELKLSYNLAEGGTKDTTAFVEGSGYFIIWGLYAPDGGGMSPVGFIKKEEKRTYTSSIGGTEDLDLPSDFPYRRLMLFTETHGVYMNQGFQYITINTNEGAKKAMDRFPGEQLIHWQSLLLKHGNFRHFKRYALQAGNNDIHPPVRFIRGVSAMRNAAGVVAVSPLDPALARVVPEGAGWQHLNFEGLCPWGALVIDFEKQSGGKDGVEAMKSCLNATEKDDIDLEFTENYTAAALSIVLEQYATQPG